MKMFKKLSFDKKLNFENIYPTTHDAICTIFGLRNYINMFTLESTSSNSLKTVNGLIRSNDNINYQSGGSSKDLEMIALESTDIHKF